VVATYSCTVQKKFEENLYHLDPVPSPPGGWGFGGLSPL